MREDGPQEPAFAGQLSSVEDASSASRLLSSLSVGGSLAPGFDVEGELTRTVCLRESDVGCGDAGSENTTSVGLRNGEGHLTDLEPVDSGRRTMEWIRRHATGTTSVGYEPQHASTPPDDLVAGQFVTCDSGAVGRSGADEPSDVAVVNQQPTYFTLCWSVLSHTLRSFRCTVQGQV